MKKVLFILFLCPFLSIAQEKAGVHFEDGLDWPAVFAKAKTENKYIFVDCYTSWCGPCKLMKNQVFPQAECGDYFNDKYVSFSIQLDSTANDNDTVKSLYAVAHDLIGKYHVNAYPTFLIFSPEGKPVTRVVGGNLKAADFIGRVKTAMLPANQYYTLLEQYQQGRKDTAFLRQMTMAAVDAFDKPISAKAANDFLRQQGDLLSESNLRFIIETTASSGDVGFKVLREHAAQADAVLGAGKAEQKVEWIILKEEVYPAFHSEAGINWPVVEKKLHTKYPLLADELILKAKVGWYETKQDWAHFLPAVTRYMKKYSRFASADDCNNFAADVFAHCSDMSCVTTALDWSKRSLKENTNANYMDTYAGILYKLGRRDEALAAEEKSIDLAGEEEKAGFRQTLERMKKGEKTWE